MADHRAVLPRRRSTPQPLFSRRTLEAFDPGWLFLAAGCALLVVTVLIPAHDDRRLAEHYRDAAVARSQHQAARLVAYGDYLDAVDRGDERLLLSLAATQLNLAPTGKAPVVLTPDAPASRSTLFDRIEPRRTPPPPLSLPETRLRRWTTDPTSRLWLIAAGAMCTLIGLLPPAVERDADD